MIVRYQMGPFGPGDSWDALDLSVRLMQGLLPFAEIHVTHQGPLHQRIEGVTYHHQEMTDPYCDGRHIPLRFDESTHELWFDNDHIMWELPDGLTWWLNREDAVLVWRNDWSYNGAYASALPNDWRACAGMWGLPPHCIMPMPVYTGQYERNQDEYGWVAKFLYEWGKWEYVDEATEVRCYCPEHNALTGRDHVGTHGVHLNGLNRGWNAAGSKLLAELRRKYL